MGTLGKSLRETLKKMAYSTSVDQLRKKGVKNVRVVGLDRIVGLIEEAVHRSLRNKLMGLERARIAGDTTEEFLKLLKSHDDLEKSRNQVLKEKQRAEEEVDELRRTLEQNKSELRDRLAEGELDMRARFAGENAAIVDKVNQVFMELAGKDGGDLSQLRDHVFELVMDVVAGERRATVEAERAAQDSEVERLQRRIGKLNGSLEQSEARLVEMASLKSVDAGISSVYRDVQGLNQADLQFARKKDLMADIFQANLALQTGPGKS